MLYTNGYQIYNQSHTLVSDSNLFIYPSNTSYYTFSVNYGNTSINGVLLLPFENTVTGIMKNSLGFIPQTWQPNLDTIFNGIYSFKIAKTDQTMLEGPVYIDAPYNYTKTRIESLAAIRHGNGRDWWVISHELNDSNTFVKYLVQSDTIIGPFYQSIGSNTYHDNALTGQSLFNRNGNKLYIGGSSGHIDVFNFNRCTGELKNFVNIKPGTFNPGVYNKERVYGMSVSPDGSKIYASGWKRLIQYSIDTNTNQLLSQDTIWNNLYYPN